MNSGENCFVSCQHRGDRRNRGSICISSALSNPDYLIP
jgi:hypothetical protein